MNQRSREYKTRVIVLRKTLFKESSYVLELLSDDLGKIPALVKGARGGKSSEPGKFEILNILSVILHKSPDAEMYLIKSADFEKSYLLEAAFKKSILMQAGAEVLLQLEIAMEDRTKFFLLLETYLDYLRKSDKYSPQIFWRFLLRAFEFSGIELAPNTCSDCQKSKIPMKIFNYPNRFLCAECAAQILRKPDFSFSPKVGEIFAGIYDLNKTDSVDSLGRVVIDEINNFLLEVFKEHFHLKLHLRSFGLWT